MKKSFNQFNNEKGSVLTIMVLIFMPLFLVGFVMVMNHARSVQGIDVDLQQAVSEAVRSAAMSVDEKSQAYNQPVIDHSQAHFVFRYVLAQNLGLDPVSLEPFDDSGLVKAPEYVLVVYNGTDHEGATSAWKYSSTDPAGTFITCAGTLPVDFSVGPDISIGTGSTTTRLDRPGCIAYIKADIKFFGDTKEAERWASSMLVKEGV